MCLGDDDDYYCYYYHYDYVLLYTIVHECQNLHSFVYCPKVMFMVLEGIIPILKTSNFLLVFFKAFVQAYL